MSKTKKAHQPWTMKEVQFLEKNHMAMNIQKLSEALKRKELTVVSFCNRMGYSYYREKEEYAFYKGDSLLKIGTVQEIADYMGVKTSSIFYYGTPTYQKRVKGGKGRSLIKLSDLEDDSIEA